ncbi:hypothetical protein CGZ75_20015 [Paenibacillus herberti]|uniref:Uncharacterized protein n=2 Tax=Paenibacillus herberti TaxID=1619309 RepID=A0A229NU68_9BACL|nr:hypothetical protein CGZ75_20015 [Paenibacillus herberti]
MKPIQTNQISPRLTVYSGAFYTGESRIMRGTIGIENTSDGVDDIRSLQFLSMSSSATLVVFTEPGFRGHYRIYRGGVHNVADLNDLIAGDRARSLISTNQPLTQAQVREIGRTGRLPEGDREI